MQKKSRPNNKLLGLLGFIGLFSLGCYEQTEGCLDRDAANFDAGADAEGPCTYPDITLEFQFRQRAGNDTVFTEGQLVQEGGQLFYFNQALIAVSNLQLVNSQSGAILQPQIEEEFYLDLDNSVQLQVLTQPFAVIERNRFLYEFGTYQRDLESFDKIVLEIGFQTNQEQIFPDSLENNSDLQDFESELYDGTASKWKDAYFEITSDTTATSDTLSVQLDWSGLTKEFSVAPQTIEPGSAIILKLRLNYLDMLAGMNEVSETALRNAIEQNILESIQLGN